MTKQEAFESAVREMAELGLVEPTTYDRAGQECPAIAATLPNALAFAQLLGMRLFDAGCYDPMDLQVDPFNGIEWTVYLTSF